MRGQSLVLVVVMPPEAFAAAEIWIPRACRQWSQDFHA